MKFSQPLEATKLVKRYKRFLADVEHPTLGEMTVHCPNTGSMKNCWQGGWTAWILNSQNTKRKYLYTWVIAENLSGELIGVNTHLANEIVFEAIEAHQIPTFSGHKEIKRELKYGAENSRIDIWLKDSNDRETFIEVKSVTLLEENGKGYFPDAVTTRGQKHLRELVGCVEQGHRAVLFFLVQHSGITSVSIAQQIDPDYAQLIQEATEVGVEIIVYNCSLNSEQISLKDPLQFRLNN